MVCCFFVVFLMVLWLLFNCFLVGFVVVFFCFFCLLFGCLNNLEGVIGGFCWCFSGLFDGFEWVSLVVY